MEKRIRYETDISMKYDRIKYIYIKFFYISLQWAWIRESKIQNGILFKVRSRLVTYSATAAQNKTVCVCTFFPSFFLHVLIFSPLLLYHSYKYEIVSVWCTLVACFSVKMLFTGWELTVESTCVYNLSHTCNNSRRRAKKCV